MDRSTAAKLGPRILEGLALWEEVQELGVDVDAESVPGVINLAMPTHPSERAQLIFRDERLSTTLSRFCQAKYGIYEVCYHAPSCKCGYKGRRGGMSA